MACPREPHRPCMARNGCHARRIPAISPATECPMHRIFVSCLLSAFALFAHAQAPATDYPYAPGRAVVVQMQRIVLPDGVQDGFEVELGGARQWVGVRGADRDNPLL